MRTAVDASHPLGIVTTAGMRDLFLPSATERMHGAPVYFGMSSSEYLYRCASQAGSAQETWAFSASAADAAAAARCDGRLWVDVHASRARTDDAATGAGVRVEPLSLVCRDFLASAPSRASALAADASAVWSAAESVAFRNGTVPEQVACVLLWRFGPYSAPVVEEPPPVTVQLPAAAITLVGDVVVRARQSLTIKGADAGSSLVMGQWHIRVEQGGVLELVHVSAPPDALLASAIVRHAACGMHAPSR
jgi:hypothetical protein